MKTRNKGNTDYQIINFSMEDGKKKTFRLHRLVMMAFNPVENMENLEVNHKDGNIINQKIQNGVLHLKINFMLLVLVYKNRVEDNRVIYLSYLLMI